MYLVLFLINVILTRLVRLKNDVMRIYVSKCWLFSIKKR